MPRTPDRHLEERILNAAQQLLLKGGEKALSMRALAKAAHTNTPALYRRFKDRREILVALVHRAQHSLSAALLPCVSPQEACRCLLEFMLEHPHECQLVNSGLFPKVVAERPNLELIKRRSVQWLGGSPPDHMGLLLTLLALVHGSATLLISKALPPVYEAELRSILPKSVDVLLHNAGLLRK